MFELRPSFRSALLLAGLLLACGGGDDPPGGQPDAGDAAGDSDPYQTELSGTIQLLENPASTTAVFADLRDAPPAVPEVVAARQGDCAVYDNPTPGSCGDCIGTCTPAGVCVPYPRTVDAGILTVTGAKENVRLRFSQEGSWYLVEPEILGDLFDEGDAIAVDAAGTADHPAFHIAGRGVAAVPDSAEQIDLVDGADYPLRWTPGDGSARIQLALRFGWHGAPYEAMLLCDTADDGALDLPRELIAMLPAIDDVGLLQWPSELTRLTRTVIAGEYGPIELVVGSQLRVALSRETGP